MPVADIVTSPTTLDNLSEYPLLYNGLIAVTICGFLSLASSVVLFLRLSWKLVVGSRRSRTGPGSDRINQFAVLLTSLLFADIQQSCAFWLEAHWIVSNSIESGSRTCWAQGWFVSTGDLASGLFTLAIAIHAFVDIIFDYRLESRRFFSAVIGLWVFNYILPIIGIALHPTEFYSRAGAWCWINGDFINERLWLHYFWLIICEFGTVIIYALLFILLQRRVRSAFYKDSETAIQARSAAKIIVAYPIVYVVCTLPLVKARLTSMANKPVSFLELTIAGAMITSNGWLDVLLYTLTRSSSAFTTDSSNGANGVLATFRHRPDQAFGTTTIIEASRVKRSLSRRGQLHAVSGTHSRNTSTEELWVSNAHLQGVKADTTVVVRTDTLELNSLRRDEHGEVVMSKETDESSVASRGHKLARYVHR